MPSFQLSYGRQTQVLIDSSCPPAKVAKQSANLWLLERNENPIKARNKILQELIAEKVYRAFCRLPADCDGLILPNESQQKDYEGNGIEFRIGAPFTWYTKIAPNGNYIHSYSYLSERWKDKQIETTRLDKLRELYLQGKATKYRHKSTISSYENYILFCHQGFGAVHYYKDKDGLSLAKEISDWAIQNKKPVIFRIHPTSEDTNVAEAKEILEHDYLIFDTKSDIVDLINKATQVWTVSSSCGMEAMLLNKPVSIFGLTDYMQVVNNCKTIDQAYKETANINDYEQFLSWYITDLCINILADEAEERIYNRMKGFLYDGIDISNLY